LECISTVSAEFQHSSIEPEIGINIGSFEIEVMSECQSDTAVFEKINEPSVEPLVTKHGWVVDKEGIRKCIGWRYGNSRIR